MRDIYCLAAKAVASQKGIPLHGVDDDDDDDDDNEDDDKRNMAKIIQ
jgi:hypothetical protein